MRQSRTDYLTDLYASIHPAHYGAATLEFRPFRGWFVVHDGPAHFGDDGYHVGDNWREAEDTIYWLCGKERAA